MPTATPIIPPLTLSEYAAMVGIHLETARQRAISGEVPGAVKLGRRGEWRIPSSAVPATLQPPRESHLTETSRQRQMRGAAARAEIAKIR